MIFTNSQVRFPKQKVPYSEKKKAEWYANCIDYIIDVGMAMNNRSEDETKIDILHGNIPYEFYKKTLNPYNSAQERYTRFPAEMRNLDIMNDIVRRYVSEYYKGNHEFTVSAENPEVILNKEQKLKEAVLQLAQQAFQQAFEQQYQQMVQQAQQQGQDPSQINPQDAMPDPEKFIKNFENNFVDDQTKQGQEVLSFIRSMTDDVYIYLSAFYDYVTIGECFTYTDVRGSKIVKEHVPVLEAYPISNGKFFVEDHDMFARKMLMSYQQILDNFDDFLTKEDRQFLDTYYAHKSGAETKALTYKGYFEYCADYCSKFTKEERDLFQKEPIRVSDDNGDLYEVWHVTWKGFAKQGILTYIDLNTGMQSQRIVDESYRFNAEAGDIDIQYEYIQQVYEGYRIGARTTAVYPMKARPVAFNRQGKLPYNGLLEVLPTMGRFSIIKIITPYQILRNIISFHREMTIAKNKQVILMYPKSLLAYNEEDAIYRMAANGTLPIDDEDDASGVKMQQVRMLNANMGDYIAQLTNLMESLKIEAREMVDMNSQRYGDIANSAAVGVTKEAISRSSMGMVVLVTMFDEMRRRDYQRDIDYAKLAYIDGLDTGYYNEVGEHAYLSLDVESFINSQLGVSVKNDAKQLEKLESVRQLAFNASQNGDFEMAVAAITGDNISQIKAKIEEFSAIKRQHEEQMQQMEQMIKQEELQARLQEIAAKGEQDRLTEQMKYYYEMQIKNIDANMSLLNNTDDPNIKANLQREVEENKRTLEQQKISLEQQRLALEAFNAAADRQVKLKDMETKLKIAKTNKNRYDK